ncbi:MAG: fluoride efflux transporter FluC [Verrucomicrobiales bacterium]
MKRSEFLVYSLAVFLGTSLGGLLRLATVQSPIETTWGLLLVNALGSGVVGFLAAAALSGRWRAFLATGVCGGFTSFSLLSLQSAVFVERSEVFIGLAYMLFTVVVSVLAVWIGHSFGRKVLT